MQCWAATMSDGVTYKKTKNKKKTMQEIRLER